ncbi:MAG: GNAT family N-acetyltransferase [Anaerolineales bacterium]
MEQVKIRQAVSGDIPALMKLDHGYSTDHVWQMIYDQNTRDVNVRFQEQKLPRPMRVNYPRDPSRLADEWTSKAGLLVAIPDEVALAYLCLLPGPAEDSLWISDLVVDVRVRRQGIATQLIEAAKDWASERGKQALFMEMQSKNYPAISLARKTDFSFAGFSDGYYPDHEIALFFVHHD